MRTGKDLSGLQFGRWTVLSREEGKGPAKWLCRCCCGTLRSVAAKNLLSGVSTSCGCAAKGKAAGQKNDLAGEKFGKLTVLGRADEEGGTGRWRCLCECGEIITVPQSSLRAGRKTNCGCESLRGKHRAKDIAGQRFHMLTALRPTPMREGNNGSIVWTCRCDCGKETNVSLDRLMRGAVISCGCALKKNREQFGNKLTHVAGTSIDALRSSSLRRDNSTGVRGVCRRKDGYEVNITFQRRMYYLGRYPDLNTAAGVRETAEELLHGSALRLYEKWRRKAETDPKWAEENPVRITVERLANGAFAVKMLPQMPDDDRTVWEETGR